MKNFEQIEIALERIDDIIANADETPAILVSHIQSVQEIFENLKITSITELIELIQS